MKKFYFSKKDVVGLVARHAVGASPYDYPENLEIVIKKLNDRLTPLFGKNDSDKGYFKHMSYEDIKDFVFKHTTAIPEFVAWNEPKIESNHPLVGTSSRFHKMKPDYDFIDLHALARNVANDILRGQVDTVVPIPLILGKESVS